MIDHLLVAVRPSVGVLLAGVLLGLLLTYLLFWCRHEKGRNKEEKAGVEAVPASQ